MRKVIAAINMTIDGFCDHTAIEPGEDIHDHYTELLRQADIALYGRITYQLMQFWQTLVEKPSGERSMDEFAKAMNQIQKIVFSNTLQYTGWESASLANRSPEETVTALKQQPGKDILLGSRSMIIQLLDCNLVDELQLCIHPVTAGGGLPLFEHVNTRKLFTLVKTKTFSGGAVIHYYVPR